MIISLNTLASNGYIYLEVIILNIKYSELGVEEKKNRLFEIFKVFSRLGITAFGGPAAHIGMMDDEVIEKRKWLSRERFMDLIGATNLIPGPNSTELAIFLGYERGGVLGLLIAGVSFIFPAMIIILLFAIIYVKFGNIPQVSSILYGIKPIIMAVIIQALYRLGKSVIKNKISLLLALGIFGLYYLGIKEIPLLLVSAVLMLLISNIKEIKDKFFSIAIIPLSLLFFIFLKIGAVLYGSGYVLLAFLEAEFIDKYGLLTMEQLLDAVAIGQFTPGPVFTSATFIGYVLRGFPGAIFATIGIFIPSFIVVWALYPVIPKLRESKIMGAMLDGVNIGSLVLMTIVSLKLGLASLVDPLSVILFIISFLILIKYKVNSAWLIIAGGAIGWISSLI